MYGDHVAVGETVDRPRGYRDAGHIDWANYWTLPIRHEHIHIRGRYRRVYPLQIDVRNFYAEGIQLRTGACLAKRQPCQSAIKVAAHGDEPRGSVLLCGNCPGAHAQEKRQKVSSHGFLQVTFLRERTFPLYPSLSRGRQSNI